jgi:hypothetical protein
MIFVDVRILQNTGIQVVLIDVSLHSKLSETITSEFRQNFCNLSNETGTKWYDMEFGCG